MKKIEDIIGWVGLLLIFSGASLLVYQLIVILRPCPKLFKRNLEFAITKEVKRKISFAYILHK
jgi:hypothetical protein